MDKVVAVDWKELAVAAEHWLLLFDSSFAHNDVPLHARPVKSATWLVKDGISELPLGESKDDFFDKEWFAALVVAVRNWYEDRYGSEAFAPDRTPLSGLTLVHGTPIRLGIPATISKVETENETAWLIFPDSIHETETVLSFFPSKPNLTTLTLKERKKLEERVSQVVKRTRSINLAIDSASDLPDKAKQMSAGLWRHVEKGVTDILTMNCAVAAVGCWELHLAMEKAFKVLAHQNGTKLTGHDLTKLAEQVQPFGVHVTSSALQQLPHWKTSIEYRYGEEEIAIDNACAIYELAIQLLDEITSSLKRDLVINNAGLLLKKPKWVGRK